MNIAVIGLGKLGSCFAAVMASQGHRVVGVDHDPAVRANLKARVPQNEPRLVNRLRMANDRLTITDNVVEAVSKSEASFIVVPTPSNGDGDFDAKAVVDVIQQIATAASSTHVAVISSTLSPGTMVKIAAEFPRLRLAYSPLFVALGQVIHDILNPDFRLIGAFTSYDANIVHNALYPLNRNGIRCEIMHPTEAEIVKLGVNTFLTLKAAYASTMAMACQSMTNVDAARVLKAIGQDHRVAPAFMAPGAVPGGPCLPRDTIAFRTWLDKTSVDDDLPRAIVRVFGEQVRFALWWCEPFDRVAILGTAYKPGTIITEASFGTVLAAQLRARDHDVALYDPMGTAVQWTDERLNNTDAIVIATEHPEYRDLDTALVPTLDMWGIVKPGKHVTVWGRGERL